MDFNVSDPIDAVITWVDGQDPAHISKKANALMVERADFLNGIPAGRDDTRFADNGEIYYCIKSLRKFAPWLRTIFLVTDQQSPPFLTLEQRAILGVTIVDHADIFLGKEVYLPTFNSISIETLLYRIPGLANKFIYLNDDFIVLKPVVPADFFQEKKVVLSGSWSKIQHYGRFRLAISAVLNWAAKKILNINRAMSLLQQMKGAEIAGMTKEYLRVPHSPHPVLKSELLLFFERNEALLDFNAGFRFRNVAQFSPIALANHLAISRGDYIYKEDSDAIMICFNRDSKKVIARKLSQLSGPDIKFLCLQSFELASLVNRRKVINFMDAILV